MFYIIMVKLKKIFNNGRKTIQHIINNDMLFLKSMMKIKLLYIIKKIKK